MAFADRIDFRAEPNLRYLDGIGRVFAGAILFSLPLLMTMEMWWLGFYLERPPLLLFVVLNFLIVVVLARVSGFEKTLSWFDDVMDAFAAYAVAAIWSFIILLLLGIIDLTDPPGVIIGKVALQSVPASFGAMLAAKQLGFKDQETRETKRERASHAGQLFLMLAGAIFLGFNVAPTEEMVLISFLMSPAQSMALIVISIVLLHGLVYTVGLRGPEKPTGPTGFWSILLRFTITGYGIAALTALYLLWTFGRIEGTNPAQIVAMVAVLAFPCSIGAALARIVV